MQARTTPQAQQSGALFAMSSLLRSRLARLSAMMLVVLATVACRPAPRTGLDFPDELPQKLSDWHIIERRGEQLVLSANVVAYDLNSPLFSDYAHKLRTVLVPPGTRLRYGEEDFEFPIGTVITKTFYYPKAPSGREGVLAVAKVMERTQGESLDLRAVTLLETRLLINTASGWVAVPYVWNAAQTEATLELAGEVFALDLVGEQGRVPFTYLVPDTNQCAGCHAVEHHEQILKPIGVKARHLNKEYRYGTGIDNQLLHWQKIELLADMPVSTSVPRNARWDAPNEALDARARAYLDVNCAHCHSKSAAANTSGLLLNASQSDPAQLGVCKIPVASGRGSGTALFDIVPGKPEESILLYRMASREPDVAMPELGRALVHEEGVSLIREWINSLSGDCAGPYPRALDPGP